MFQLSNKSDKSGVTGIAVVIIIAIVMALFILIPHIAIWAVNTLIASGGVKNFAIGHTGNDWLAMLVLIGIFAGSSAGFSSKN